MIVIHSLGTISPVLHLSCPSLIDASTVNDFSMISVAYTGANFQPFIYNINLTVIDNSDITHSVSTYVSITLLEDNAPVVILSSSHMNYKVNVQDAVKLTVLVTLHSEETLT